ncbi:hypothetical protein K501DRAFT_282465 [Backusella circina FSU 941]|nr:hypothetical protein K501DRAFT_282465 [Backusella circina FSU 941]
MSNYTTPKKQSGITDKIRARTNPFAAASKKPQERTSVLASIHSASPSGVPKGLYLPHTKDELPYSRKRVTQVILDDDTPSSSLVVPKKLKTNPPVNGDKLHEKSDSIDKILNSLKEDKENDNKTNCPFCFTTFPFVPQQVQKALDKIEDKNKQYKEKIKAQEVEGDSLFRKPDALIQRPISSEEKSDFCRLHRIEILIKPQAETKGYPTQIRFAQLHHRIQTLIPELESVVRGKTHSDYRDIALKAYEELGTNKARSSIAVMSRFEDLLPGYYGPRGASIISDVLTDAFLASDILTIKLAAPQRPHEYVQQVLIPETAYRLIKEDYDDLFLDDDEAKRIMRESVEYGEVMHPLVDDDIDT